MAVHKQVFSLRSDLVFFMRQTGALFPVGDVCRAGTSVPPGFLGTQISLELAVWLLGEGETESRPLPLDFSIPRDLPAPSRLCKGSVQGMCRCVSFLGMVLEVSAWMCVWEEGGCPQQLGTSKAGLPQVERWAWSEIHQHMYL